MQAEERIYLIGLLGSLISETQNLEYKNYSKAEEICHRLLLFAGRHFPGHSIYIQNLTGIKFRANKMGESANLKAWEEGKGKLIATARAMVDDLNYPESAKNTVKQASHVFFLSKRKTIAIIIFIVLSVLLWTFNSVAGWIWLSTHPKRLSIYISVQILIACLILFFIVQGKKKVGMVEAISIIAPLLYGLASVLDR